MSHQPVFVKKNNLILLRNNKNYFSTTTIIKKEAMPRRKILFKTPLNYFKLMALKNNSFLKRKEQLKLVLRAFRKEFRKQYAFKLEQRKQRKTKKYQQEVSKREKLFLKRILFKKVLNIAIKKMNSYILRRARIVYKQVKQERLKLIFAFQKEQRLHNHTIERLILQKQKVRKFLYAVDFYEDLLKVINKARQKRNPYYFTSLNYWRSQSSNYFQYYHYRRKCFYLKNIKGITILPGVNQQMRKYFSKKYKYSLASQSYFHKTFVYRNKKKYRFFAKHSKYEKYNFIYNVYKFRVQQGLKTQRRFFKKYKKNQRIIQISLYRMKKLWPISIQHGVWNLKLKKKFKKARLLLIAKKKRLKGLTMVKKSIQNNKTKQRKLLINYKAMQTVFVKRFRQKFSKKKQIINFLKKLMVLKKRYYLYAQQGTLLKTNLKKKRRAFLKYTSTINLFLVIKRLRNRFLYALDKRKRLKKINLSLLMRMYNQNKANNVMIRFKKKKNYKKAVTRFFTKNKQKRLSSYMQSYQYYRLKMLYFNFFRGAAGDKNHFYSNYKKTPYYKMPKKKLNYLWYANYKNRAQTTPIIFNQCKPQYNLVYRQIFRSIDSKKHRQLTRRQMKYTDYRLYHKYFKQGYKRKVLNKEIFGIKRRIRKILPWRVKKFKYSYYNYQRFSYYWLRYFFHRFRKIYLTEETAPLYYSQVKRYLLTWLGKVSRYKSLSLHQANPARGFLIYKSSQLYSKYKKKAYPLLLLQRFKPMRYFLNRQKLDWMLRRQIFKQRFVFRSLYRRYYKDFFERKKMAVLNRQYRFRHGYLPYVFTKKKHKMFYNWADRHVLKRFPLYRYKYTLFFKFPRYADYRRLFKNQLREQHIFRYLYRLKLSQLIKHYRKATYKTKRIFELMFLKHFELRLDTVVYRLNFAWSLKHARQLVLRGLFLVNNKIIDSHRYHIGLGDVIMPIKRVRTQQFYKKYLNIVDSGVWLTWNRLFFRYIQVDQYPEHFFLNERVPAGMLIGNVNPYKVRYNKPFSLQFLTLSLLKYN